MRAALPAIGKALAQAEGESTDTLVRTDAGLKYDPAVD